jgi:hypothetical protein
VKSCRDFDRHGSHPVSFRKAPPMFREEKAAFMRYLYADKLATPSLHRGSKQAFDDLLVMCQANGIGVTLVMLPESPAFQALYSPSLLAETRALMDDAATRYGAGLVDARDWVTATLFMDGHHLYELGASRFTARLWRERLATVLAGQSTSQSD